MINVIIKFSIDFIGVAVLMYIINYKRLDSNKAKINSRHFWLEIICISVALAVFKLNEIYN